MTSTEKRYMVRCYTPGGDLGRVFYATTLKEAETIRRAWADDFEIDERRQFAYMPTIWKRDPESTAYGGYRRLLDY